MAKSQNPTNQGLRVAIIGGGMSGICMACKLLDQLPGVQLCIFELNDKLGGTWYTHQYPGVACDSPSHLYSFWFSPNPGFKSKFASGAENLAYLQSVAAKFNLDKYVQYRTEVVNASWNEKRSVWVTTIRNLQEGICQPDTIMEFDVVISCAGGQRRPIKPDYIVDHFNGPVYHSSECPNNLDLHDKSVAVIGTGSSSIQIVPFLANLSSSSAPKEIHVFQKSPGWILKLPRGDFSDSLRALFEYFPALLWMYRFILLVYYDIFIHWLLRRQDMMRSYALSALRSQIPEDMQVQSSLASKEKDDGTIGENDFQSDHLQQSHTTPSLISSLTPDWSVGCRRVMVSDTYYPALLKENVFFHPSRVTNISKEDKNTLLTSNGETIRADVVILATGYNYHDWIRPLEVKNHLGEEIVDVRQKSEVRGRYFGLATSSFPNLFHLFGPASRPGQGALSTIAELQAAEIIKCLKQLTQLPQGSTLSISLEAENVMARRIQKGIVDSPFGEKCGGWYKNKKGFPSTLWPFTAFRFNMLLRSFNRKKTWEVSTPSSVGKTN